ncbi:hypothetical protein D1872_240800 [compost metagenome]
MIRTGLLFPFLHSRRRIHLLPYPGLIPHLVSLQPGFLEQVGDRNEFVAFFAELVDNDRQRFVRLLGGIAGMEQDDIAGVRFADDSFYNRIASFVHPVLGIRIPLDDLVAKVMGNFQHAFVKIAVRQPEQIWCFTCYIG